jgi:alpha-D-ribose 1-methylphosphonate 5-triphosphate synthase subunit PhnG
MLKMELIFAIKINVAYRIQYFREQSFYYFVQSGHDLYAHRATICDLYLQRSRKGVVEGTLVAAKKKKRKEKKKKRKKLRIKRNVNSL